MLFRIATFLKNNPVRGSNCASTLRVVLCPWHLTLAPESGWVGEQKMKFHLQRKLDRCIHSGEKVHPGAFWCITITKIVLL